MICDAARARSSVDVPLDKEVGPVVELAAVHVDEFIASEHPDWLELDARLTVVCAVAVLAVAD